jgi:hypothetical protein
MLTLVLQQVSAKASAAIGLLTIAAALLGGWTPLLDPIQRLSSAS